MSQTVIWGWPAAEFVDASTGDFFTVDLLRGTVVAGTYRSRGVTVGPEVDTDPVSVAERFARDNDLIIPVAKPESDIISDGSDLYRVTWREESNDVVLPRILEVDVVPSRREVVRFLSVFHDLPSSLIPRVSQQQAGNLATGSVDYHATVDRVELAVLPIDLQPRLVWRVGLTGGKQLGAGEGIAMAEMVYVDAVSGLMLDPFPK